MPTVDSLRQQFLDFYAAHDHRVVPSASLIPESPSTLLTGAGMQPFVPAYRGEAAPPALNVASAQKCVRSGDIEEVGRTARHHTFFEMMGNFSFGGYMKEKAIALAWELVTGVWGVDPDLCWATVYTDDDDSAQFWHTVAGVPRERILRMGKKDNWWPQTVWDGPCGPCTEIYVDQGPSIPCDDPDKGPASGGDRFLEIWNLVFQMYNQSLDGSMVDLAVPGVDTGLGLERLAAVLQGVPSNYDTDIFAPIMAGIADASKRYGTDTAYRDSDRATVSYRAIADHARSIAFMIGDGILPSNEGRGYVLRRILRRAFRFARALGVTTPFLHELIPVVAKTMSVGYPELIEKVATTSRIVKAEEERFCSTLEQGLARLQDLMDGVRSAGGDTLPGDEVFRLYDTFGFHRELTEEFAAEAGLRVDAAGYEKALERQRSRSVFKHTESAAAKAFYVELARETGVCEFVRDPEPAFAARVTAIVGGEERLDSVEEGAECAILLDRTPFYAEKGGQAADRGTIATPAGRFDVSDVREPVDGLILHIGKVASGTIAAGEAAEPAVNTPRRNAIRRAHTATHLLHAALREHIGPHVAQAGSLVEEDRLRFDFSHFEAVTRRQLEAVERSVQSAILASEPVETRVMSLEDAQATGAMALFGEKYADQVRVVTMGDASKELCGGTHLDRTSEVGAFVILSESSVAAGTRRVEALTGLAALEHIQAQRSLVAAASERLGAPVAEIVSRIGALQDSVRDLRKQIQDLKRRGAGPDLDGLLGQAQPVTDGLRLVSARVDDADPDALSALADRIVERDGACVALLATVEGDKVPIVCKVGPEALAKGAQAGKLASEVAKACGGGGGGRPEFARAGGKAPAKLDQALAGASEALRTLLRA